MSVELTLRLGMTLHQVASAMRRFASERSHLLDRHRPITMTAWLLVAVAVKKLERDAFNDGVERAARLSEEWGGVPARIRRLKR